MGHCDNKKKGFLERLDAGEVVVGDGGFVFSLEKRGYVKAGPWTPEATVEHPEAVLQLHHDFGRAGSDVFQAFTFYASEDKLENRGNDAAAKFTASKINEAACELARKAASQYNGLVAGGVSQTPTYLSNIGEAATKEIFRKQCQVFKAQNVDFMICEYFEHVEEAVWAIDVCREFDFEIAASLCCSADGDLHGVSIGECGVRMVQAGARCVGINCHFDPATSIEAVVAMKRGVEAAGLTTHYMVQPLAFHTPEATKQGFITLKEFPFALEPRVCTRWDMHKFARAAYDQGIRFIGGCCGFEPYHIRAVSEELIAERGGFVPPASSKHELYGGALKMHTKPWVRIRCERDYWYNLEPASGRPRAPAFCNRDDWRLTQGADELKQTKEQTSSKEIQALKDLSVKLQH